MNLGSIATSFLTQSDPFPLLFQALNDIWHFQDSDDVDTSYVRYERDTNNLEDFINSTYFELYELLLNKIRSTDRANELASYQPAAIVMDGLSLREANWLIPRLEKRGFIVTDYSLTFSQTPATTQCFFQNVFGTPSAGAMPKKWHGFSFRSIKSGDVPKLLDSPNALIWLSFPDELLHPMKGKGVTPSFALSRTEEALLKILDIIETDEVVLTSDHGYIYTQSATLFWHPSISYRKLLLKLFGAQRGILFDASKAAEFEDLCSLPKDQTYVLFDDKGCYVRGRYYWSAPGKQSDVAHGGISLMECLVPIIRLRKR